MAPLPEEPQQGRAGWRPLIASCPRLPRPSPSSLRFLVQLRLRIRCLNVVADQPIQVPRLGWLVSHFVRLGGFDAVYPTPQFLRSFISPHLSATHSHSPVYTPRHQCRLSRGIHRAFVNRFIIVSPFISSLAVGLESPPLVPLVSWYQLRPLIISLAKSYCTISVIPCKNVCSLCCNRKKPPNTPAMACPWRKVLIQILLNYPKKIPLLGRSEVSFVPSHQTLNNRLSFTYPQVALRGRRIVASSRMNQNKKMVECRFVRGS
ncbi:hypothetical protein LY78DRAFT_378777 [Colletotrichum sublineola]|nr:hypothetical protein LY78DRAFT_378777 [Colletotrichum sublineola]